MRRKHLPKHNNTLIHSTGKPDAWRSFGANTECDAGAGEKYRGQSSGKQSSLALCKQSCQNEDACKSITYYSSGWCSHFSTDCSNTKTSSGAVAMQKLLGAAGTTPARTTGEFGTDIVY